MKDFVVINDELRIGDIDFTQLNKNEIRCKGTCILDRARKQITFFSVQEEDPFKIIRDVKLKGFYTPEIANFKWYYGESPSYFDIKT